MGTLIVEDGTMPPGANAYASVADCDAYQLSRASTAWPTAPEIEDPDNPPVDPNEASKEAALIKATDYLNGLSWHGRKAAGGRVMAWPRQLVIDNDGYPIAEDNVPLNVNYACCFLAGIIYDGTNVQPTLERGGRIQSDSVGSLSTSYFDDAANRDVYSAVADLLGGLAYGLGEYAGTGTNGGGMGAGRVVVG